MKTTEHSKWGTFTKGLQARFLRLWCNLQKSWWERVIPLKRMGFFSSINLLPFSPLTAGTSNSTNPVYLLKRHFLSHLLSAGYSHTTTLPSVHLSLRQHFVSALIPLWELRDTLCPCYLKHPHFPPRYTACMACMDHIFDFQSFSTWESHSPKEVASPMVPGPVRPTAPWQ